MMTRTLMAGSALLLAVLGVSTLFFPLELAVALGLDASAELAVQLIAGGWLAAASLNWMGRSAIFGGIYGKPIVLANLTLGVVTALTLVSALLRGRIDPWAWLPTVIFVFYAAGFARLMWSTPQSVNSV